VLGSGELSLCCPPGPPRVLHAFRTGPGERRKGWLYAIYSKTKWP
jgi:hypothetical protein